LIAQYGSLEDVIAHADELSPARGRAVKEHADQARDSKVLATLRRDLPLEVDPAELVSAPPDRSTLKEIFRRFEFRGLLSRVDTLDAALPSAQPQDTDQLVVPWREAAPEELVLNQHKLLGVAYHDRRAGLATGDEVLVVEGSLEDVRRAMGTADLLAHDAKAQRLGQVHDDTLIAAYLVDPGRSGYEIDDLAREYGLELVPEPATEEETAALVRRAESARRLAPTLRARVREWGMERLYDEIELPLTRVLADMEDAGIRIDTYRMGEITARLAERVEELETSALDLAGEAFQLGSTQQLARILFEKLGLTAGR
jgi:DNA polymerase-1